MLLLLLRLVFGVMIIAIGLGLGANQIAVTVVASLFILLVAGVISVRHRSEEGQDIYLSVGWIGDSPSIGTRLDALNSVLAEHTIHTDLRRVDSRDGALEANYFVRFRNGDEIPRLFDRFDQEYGRGTVSLSVIDQSRTLGP